MTEDYFSRTTSSQGSGIPFQLTAGGGRSVDELYDYGMSAEDATKSFDSAYAEANKSFSPFDSSRLNAERDRNVGLFNKAEGLGDVTGTLNALAKARGSNLTVGQQLSSGAARQYEEQSGPGRNSAIGSSMVRAQALLPFLQQDYAGAADEQKYADNKKAEAIGMASNIAQTLAGLATTYTNSLADFNAQKAGLTLDYAKGKSGMGLQAATTQSGNKLDLLKTQLSLRENARQFDETKRMQKQAAVPAFAGDVGFKPVGGPMRYSPAYLDYKAQYGL